MEVRNARYASAICDFGCDTEAEAAAGCQAVRRVEECGWHGRPRGITASDGRAVIICACSNECTLLSRDSRMKASETPPARPTSREIMKIARDIWRRRCGWSRRRIYNAHVARPQPGHHTGFLQFLQQSFI